MPKSVEEFFSRLSESGLLSVDETAAIDRSLELEEVVAFLTKQGKITSYQAEVLSTGQGTPIVLGDYVVLEKIGEGGMGQVFKARHRRMDRTVALKILPSNVTKDEIAVKRFEREVKAAARLSHPNIVIAHDAGESGGTHYLITEYVDGIDLSALVKRSGPLSVAEAIDCVRQAAIALAYAHAEGVIHRDIKPSNILLDSAGVVKVLDMGLARFETGGNGDDAETQAELTGTGEVMGTVDYMAPEQALDTKHADASCDVYSLGCTLHYLLTGRPVYGGESLMQRLVAHREQPIPSLTEVSAELDAVFQRMVAKKTEDRFQSMAEVVEALQASCPIEPGSSGTVGSSTQTGSYVSSAGKSQPSTMVKAEKKVASDETMVGKASDATQPSVAGTTTQHRLVKRRAWKVGVAAVAGVVVAAVYLNQPPEESAVLPDPPPVVAGPADSPNYALEFDKSTASEQYVELPIKFNGQDPMTIEAHVRPTRQARTVFDSDRMRLARRGDNWVFIASEPGKDGLRGIRSDALVTPNRAYHLAGVWDGMHLRLYINGQSSGYSPKRPKLGHCKLPFRIGSHYLATSEAPFSGLIDEVRISNTARYTKDFTPQKRFDPDEHTLALYHCDDIDDTNVLLDSSGNGHHGKIVGAKYVRADGSAIKQLSPTEILTSPDWKWTEPVNLGGVVNGDDWDASPAISTDGLTLVFVTKRPGNFGEADLWSSTRKSIDDSWSQPVNLGPNVNSSAAEGASTLSADGLTMIFHLNRSEPQNIVDLWQCKRDSTDDPWSSPTKLELKINESERPADPTLSNDGLTLLFHSARQGSSDLWQCTRDSTSNPWSSPAKLSPVVNSNERDGSPCLASDGRTLLFRSTRPGGEGDSDLWMCVRKSLTAPWSPPVPLGSAVNSSSSDAGPALSTDGRTLYFHSDRPGGHGRFDIWMSRRVLKSRKTPADPDRAAAEWVLGIGGTILADGRKITDVGQLPQKSFRITSINVGSQQVTDDDLEPLKGLTKLTDLGVDRTGITDAGLEHLMGLTTLTYLQLRGTQVSDKGLERLTRLVNLAVLRLSETQVSDTGLQHLKGLTKLTTLDLQKTKVTAQGIADLKKALPKCTITYTSDGKTKTVGPEDPDRVAAIRVCELIRIAKAEHNLVTVHIADTVREIRSVDEIPKQPFRVKDIQLENNQSLVDADILLFCKLPQLYSLVLDRTKISDDALREIGDIRTLQNLSLDDTSISDDGLKHLGRLSNLAVLSLFGTRVSDAGLKHLGSLSNLKKLDLQETDVADSGLKDLGSLTKLTVLSLSHTRVSDTGLKHLGSLSNLTILGLSHTGVSDTGLGELGRLSNLETLGLQKTRVSDASVEVLKRFRKMTVLDVQETSISRSGIERIAEAIPNCRITYTSGSEKKTIGPKDR